MIELTFLEFHEQQYEEQQFCLYVVKNETDAFWTTLLGLRKRFSLIEMLLSSS